MLAIGLYLFKSFPYKTSVCDCAYVLSMLAHAYDIITDCGVGEPVHVRKVVDIDGLNATDKRLLSMLIKNMQLPSTEAYGSYMTIYTSTVNTDISLARSFLKWTQHWHRACCITARTENMPVNGSALRLSIMSKTAKMFHTHQLNSM